MRQADQVLEDDALLPLIQQELSKRCKKSKTRGRPSTPAEVVLRLALLKHMRNWSFAVLAREVRANLVYREFTRIGGGKVPDDKTMGRLTRQLSPALVRQIHARDPDYIFARAKLADFHLKRGELEAAKALLDPLMERKRFHTSEFAAFAGGQIAILLAEKKTEGARSWVQMWEQIDPDHPNLRYWKDRLTPRGTLGRLLGPRR